MSIIPMNNVFITYFYYISYSINTFVCVRLLIGHALFESLPPLHARAPGVPLYKKWRYGLTSYLLRCGVVGDSRHIHQIRMLGPV